MQAGGYQSWQPVRFLQSGRLRDLRSDLCLRRVTWHADSERLEDIFPWYDGAHCYVTPVPAGYTGRVLDNKYYVESTVDCPPGTTAGGPGCRLAVLPLLPGNGA